MNTFQRFLSRVLAETCLKWIISLVVNPPKSPSAGGSSPRTFCFRRASSSDPVEVKWLSEYVEITGWCRELAIMGQKKLIIYFCCLLFKKRSCGTDEIIGPWAKLTFKVSV